jgi:hypothetical protein
VSTRSVARLQADLDRWTAYVRPAVLATKSGVVGGVTISSGLNAATFDADVKSVRANIQTLHDRMAGILTGMPFRR